MKLYYSFLLCLSLMGCHRAYQSPMDIEKLKAIVEHKDTFKMSEVTNLKWDKMYAIAPYTPEKIVVTKFNQEIDSAWMSNEGICLVVFYLDSKIIAHYDLSRKVADFIGLGREDGISYNNCECKVTRSNGGYGPYITPIPN